MEKHVTVVGVLHIGMGALWLLGAVVVLAMAPIVFASTAGPGAISGDPDALAILTAIGSGLGLFFCGVGVFVALLAVPGIVGGIGVLRLKPWARYLVLILAVLDLFNIPVGTAVGVYTIWAMVQDETAQLFATTSSQ
jgi:hypothetical protein